MRFARYIKRSVNRNGCKIPKYAWSLPATSKGVFGRGIARSFRHVAIYYESLTSAFLCGR